MERRNRSLEALNRLQYIDSLDDELRGESLKHWVQKYLTDEDIISQLDLSQNELEIFSELFYKNINFLKQKRDSIQKELKQNQNIQKFLS
jgi:hypothetical protein